MDAASLLAVVNLLEGAGIEVWLDGGWGVDALLERETREHDDLDLVCDLLRAERVIELLARLGYELAAGGSPKSFACVDSLGRQIDVHPVAFDAEGGGHYLMEEGRVWVYPAEGFSGRGRVAGRVVMCLSPEVQVIVHAGYELTEKDYRRALSPARRFGVEVPDELLERVLATGP
jgi:lincosamide nucleotidyltransferase A/C/D/E